MSPSPLRRLLAATAAALCLLPASSALGAQADDPLVAQAWQLSTDGPMGVQTAWDQTTGSDVVVAVVDTGVDLTHPDLAANLWTNPGEIPGNGIDDDHDGFVDDVHGADFVNNDGDPSDDNGHGTHVAGIIGARGNNGVGTAGVAWRARLMAVKVLDRNASGDAYTVAQGVRYAVAHGARIVNLSLAGPAPSKDLEDAIAYARDNGVLVVCAAGNSRLDLGVVPMYPASLTEPNLLSVAATNPDGGLSVISDFGRGVDLAAPGEAILSTALGGGYELRTGTSMAAPEVAGAAALVESASGGAAGWDSLTSALVAGARPSALPVGAGTLDVGGALRKVIPGAQWRSPAVATAPAATAKKATTAKKKKASSKKRKKRSTKARTARRHKAKKARRRTTRRRVAHKVRAHAARSVAPRGSRHLRHVVYRAA